MKSGVLLGSAYYPEYQSSPDVHRDMSLMRAAGLSVIRVGESVWSTWEPRDGEFNLEWLAPVLDAAEAHSLSVILGTPTYAVPPWLQKSHPELAADHATGQRVPWGSRQEIDHSNPVFRRYAERVIRKVVGRYADHPAVVGFQVDNEPGLVLLHNSGTFERFVRDLEVEYGSIENINREWGLTYWSHRLSEWSELWRPDGNTSPQYDLAWRRFQARLTTEFIAWQAKIVREYSRDKFVTTCIAYLRPGVKDAEVSAGLDISSGNAYFATQDHLHYSAELCAPHDWVTSGVPALFRQGDRMYSSKQDRFLVTETNAQSIAGSDFNQVPYPGQLRQAALAFVARGATLIEYWHWQSLHVGLETYWGGILPHSRRQGRIYREISEIGADLARLGCVLDNYVPDADVALIWSDDSRYALEFAPPFRSSGNTYEQIFNAFHTGALDAGLQSRIIHDSQVLELPAEELVRQFPVLAAPALYIASDALLELLDAYAQAGGHLVIGMRTGYADEEARARADIAPPGLSEAAGVRYDEFSSLPSNVVLSASPTFRLSPGAAATEWADGLCREGADVLVGYEHDFFGKWAAVTTNRRGAGRVTYVGTLPNRELAADIFRWVQPRGISGQHVEAAANVTVTSGLLDPTQRALFAHNWSPDPTTVRLLQPARDAFDDSLLTCSDVSLPPWSCRVLVAQLDSTEETTAPPQATLFVAAITK